MPKLTVVQASAPPVAERLRLRRKADPRPAAMLQCRCGSREVIEVRAGVLYQGGKTKGGTKALICAACWLKGKRVPLT